MSERSSWTPGRVAALLAAMAGWGVVVLLLLTPMHGAYDAGMPTMSSWGVERMLAGDGKFISFRQGLFGGNLLAAYFAATMALPALLLLVQPAWHRASAHIFAGAALVLLSAGGLVWLGGYHLFAVMVAVPGWGVVAVAAHLAASFMAGVMWLVLGIRWGRTTGPAPSRG